ncbi:peptidoglycan-binding domain-containing protein [Fodinibius sp. AD559]|uniref:peptidoglycan-binding domain-containing protein n=1 Tax=Fodinibius sp. AD559 TaxID=3424179 RepID=UPI004046DA42
MSLRKGNKGPQVMHLQSALRAMGIPLPNYGVDGIFGPETESAVLQAQQSLGLPPTGVADQTLIRRLGIDKKTMQPQQQKISNPGGVWLLGAVAIVGIGIAIKKATTE